MIHSIGIRNDLSYLSLILSKSLLTAQKRSVTHTSSFSLSGGLDFVR